MFFGDAEANTSAGAPLLISVASPELGPKLNFTVSPGCAASNCVASFLKDPVSEDAANTVIVPVDEAAVLVAAGLLVLEVELAELLLEQPATATAASVAAMRMERFIYGLPKVC
jgi:hypothetical protein